MGFFSWNCELCGHPMLSHYVLEDQNEWMNKVVVLEKDGSILRGEYDGYGRADEHEMDAPQCYHRACWEAAGKPTEWNHESKPAIDQGYFFEGGVHNLPEPKDRAAATALRMRRNS